MRMATVYSDLRTQTCSLQPEHLSRYIFEVIWSMPIE
jgi:hypothetical protein